MTPLYIMVNNMHYVILHLRIPVYDKLKENQERNKHTKNVV